MMSSRNLFTALFILSTILFSEARLPLAHGISDVIRRHKSVHIRDVLPDGWSAAGCYSDSNPATRTFAAAVTFSAQLTHETCVNFCASHNYIYAGLEYSQECYCDNFVQSGGPVTDGCTMPCAGNSTQICGGPLRLTVFKSSAPPPPLPSTVASYKVWTSQGCFTDSTGARTLGVPMAVAGQVTIEKCLDACFAGGYLFAGAEYAAECYCGNSIRNGGTSASSGCTMTCAGNSSEFCGGPNRLNMYSRVSGTSSTASATTTVASTTSSTTPTATATPPPDVRGNWTSLGCYTDNVGGRSLTVPLGVNGPMTVNKCLDVCFNAGYAYSGVEYSVECYCGTTLSNGAAPAADGCNMPCAGNAAEMCGGPNRLNLYHFGGELPPIIQPPTGGGPPLPYLNTSLPAPWHYAGCWVDLQFGRILVDNTLADDPGRTIQQCVNHCKGLNYTIAGLEYSVQCFCGNDIRYAGTLATNQNDCNMPCGGDPAHGCGAGNRLSVYSSVSNITVYAVPAPKTTNLPGSWAYKGCYKEPDFGNPRTFLRQIIFDDRLSPAACLNLCAQYGYPVAGLEFGTECYCGDEGDIAAHGAVSAPEADCNTACPAEPASICGAALRLSIYRWNGTLTTWDVPTNKGRYEFLIGGPVVPLQTSLGLNNKVTLLEKLGSGPQNSTHAYEFDYTIGDIRKAWREMHVKTDVFCSAGLMLPDKAGRQLNIGGWSLESTFGVRLYTPDGSLGVNGTNDWQEDVNLLALQRARWYPSAMVMSNGSIVVLGGQIGANDRPSPNLELLPRTPGGDTVLYMDWMERTDPFNLYPFMHVLPSGGIYVAYYNEARILNQVTFATNRELPIAPGAVNIKGGRTYPFEGSGVMLPQHAPYTDPVTMMSCGGSDGFYALDNCVTIQPEVPNPQWVIERMPFPRVMPCLVSLPDGTFLIVNGARQGTAGFGLAVDPVLTAVLYDPAKPIGTRMSILGSTIVARLYHSEAILMHDGRVLITGSDPLDTRYPEEYRVEVYVPPYLSSGLPQPTFNIGNKDWAYNGQYTLTITSSTGGPIRVSLVGGGVSTHGNSFGQRIIFPAVSCAGQVCTVTAPPNNRVCPPGWFQIFVLDGPTPSHSTWVRIGGDPGHLGEWPNLPGFTPPGM